MAPDFLPVSLDRIGQFIGKAPVVKDLLGRQQVRFQDLGAKHSLALHVVRDLNELLGFRRARRVVSPNKQVEHGVHPRNSRVAVLAHVIAHIRYLIEDVFFLIHRAILTAFAGGVA